MRQAIAAMTQTRFPAIFLKFKTFATLGKMTALNPDALGGSPVARSVGDLSTLLTRWRDGEAL